MGSLPRLHEVSSNRMKLSQFVELVVPTLSAISEFYTCTKSGYIWVEIFSILSVTDHEHVYDPILVSFEQSQ
jgi:hypothetical protein